MTDGFGKFSGADVERAKSICRNAGIPPDNAIRHGPGVDPEAVATCDVLFYTPHWCLAALGASAERARLRAEVQKMLPVLLGPLGRARQSAFDDVLALLPPEAP